MKRVMKIILAGICIGIVLLLIQKIFRIDENTLIQGYWIVAFIVVIGAVLINICYNFYYSGRIKKSIQLMNEGKIQEYTDCISKLLKTAKGKNLRKILKLNLAAGYMEMKQFEHAISILEELSEEGLKGSLFNMIHRINLCQSYFETGQYDKASAIYEENQPLFLKYKEDKDYGGYILMVDVEAAIMNGQYILAEELLKKAKTESYDMRLQKGFQELSDMECLKKK